MSAEATLDGPKRKHASSNLVRQLRVVHGPSKGRAIDLGGDDPIVVGRSAGSGGVVLPDPLASRLHFEIVSANDPTRFKIRDLGSHNGTKVNGVRITSVPIAHGDVIRAGDSLLVYCEQVAQRHSNLFVRRAARSDLHVLILGESGVGKEVMARKIHDASGRTGPFVAINCTAVPRDLLVSELCGHVRGAFSGAQQARDGLFLSARGGTLMLDEIGDMALDLQPVLLRILETRTVRPVGGDRELPVDVRVIAATNSALRDVVETGKFRRDLYARLAQLVTEVQPLRARREEILDLSCEFGSKGKVNFAMDADLAEALVLWDWPFNVRELRSLIKAMQVSHEDRSTLHLDDLSELRTDIACAVPSSRAPVETSVSSGDTLADRSRLVEALRSVDGNVAALARKLGTSRSHVYRWLKRWDIPAQEGSATADTGSNFQSGLAK